jgi:hypothetical protein
VFSVKDASSMTIDPGAAGEYIHTRITSPALAAKFIV